MSENSPAPEGSCPPSVIDRVRLYQENLAEYHSPTFNEANLRNSFLQTLFHDGLGWDVNNDAGAAESYKDVLVEETLSLKHGVQRLDYVFRIGGIPKFIVEAKKPSINILEAQDPALQLRRYGWNKKLPLCVLTNFEAFAIYDTRVRPKPEDGAGVARLRYYSYTDYPQKWPELWQVFSHKSVLSGRFDRETQRQPTRGREEVDETFLREIELWREDLAKNLKLRNPSLNRQELNFAVQATIDRIIFLRICEDRGVEPPRRLKSSLGSGPIYPRLVDLFLQADQRYNSGIFHFEKERGRASTADALTPKLIVDDEVLERIVSRLYPPVSPYDFSALPVEILGQVYERFLGKVIEVTEKRARIEPKPEVRKAGGVYYTPSFIVDRIVRETLGPLTEGKSPDDVATLRVVDPACGSGSFLIGGYQFLLDWHLGEYIKEPRRWKARIAETGASSFVLVPKERRRILLQNVFGVDIDPQAVEVTKLSLLLKVLERTPGEVLDLQLKLSHERALPDLDANIRCGNSLLDYRQIGQILLDDDTRRRVNPFDWKSEFPGIFEKGGFDVVLGNPPYIRVQLMKEWAPLEVELYKRNYKAASKGNYDIYVCFIERGLSLLSPRGRLGFILPHKFFNAVYGASVRELISSGHYLSEVVHFGHQQVFQDATTYTCLLFLDKAGSRECNVAMVDNLQDWILQGSAREGVVPATKIGGKV